MTVTDKLKVNLKIKTKQIHFFKCLAILFDEKLKKRKKGKTKMKAYFIMIA